MKEKNFSEAFLQKDPIIIVSKSVKADEYNHCLMLSLLVWPKVITLSGFYFICIPQVTPVCKLLKIVQCFQLANK
jgi:hypothetical protein